MSRWIGQRCRDSRPDKPICLIGDRSLSEVFKIFALIHRVTTDAATVTRITEEVLLDFANDQVVYAELRTTPKVHSISHLRCFSLLAACRSGDRMYNSAVRLPQLLAAYTCPIRPACETQLNPGCAGQTGMWLDKRILHHSGSGWFQKV